MFARSAGARPNYRTDFGFPCFHHRRQPRSRHLRFEPATASCGQMGALSADLVSGSTGAISMDRLLNMPRGSEAEPR